MNRKVQEEGTPAKRGHRLSKERLDELVEEALVDAYGESEQATAFYTMLENDLRLPFETEMLGGTVTVEGIDITEDDQLVAVCRKGKHRQRISLRGFAVAPNTSGGGGVDPGISALANRSHVNAPCGTPHRVLAVPETRTGRPGQGPRPAPPNALGLTASSIRRSNRCGLRTAFPSVVAQSVYTVARFAGFQASPRPATIVRGEQGTADG